MKAKSPTIITPDRFVMNGTQFSPRTAGTAPQQHFNARKFTTNFHSPSSVYQQLNEVVKYLDSLFKTLTIPEKFQWDQLAANNPDKQLCGCAKVAMDGQKFYRGTNLRNIMNFLPPINTPVTTTPQPIQYVALISRSTTLPGPVPCIEIDLFDHSLQTQVTINHREGLDNPTEQSVPPGNLISVAGQPIFDAIYNLPGNPIIEWCCNTNWGMPLSTGRTQLI